MVRVAMKAIAQAWGLESWVCINEKRRGELPPAEGDRPLKKASAEERTGFGGRKDAAPEDQQPGRWGASVRASQSSCQARRERGGAPPSGRAEPRPARRPHFMSVSMGA